MPVRSFPIFLYFLIKLEFKVTNFKENELDSDSNLLSNEVGSSSVRIAKLVL